MKVVIVKMVKMMDCHVHVIGSGLEKNLRFLEKVFRLLRFFNVRKTAQKITTQKFTKNISYTIHPFPCHVVSHVQTIA